MSPYGLALDPRANSAYRYGFRVCFSWVQIKAPNGPRPMNATEFGFP
jgi:hypothetical protein